MEQGNMDKGRWLTTATKGIRFGPDRAEVLRELRDHLDDRTDDLRRIFPDMTYEEAEKRALAGMGDPEEIGKELARVHRPWLGYLWRVSQWMLGLAVLFAVIIGVQALTGGWTPWFEPGSGLDPRHEDAVITCVTPDPDRKTVDGRWITMPEAARMEFGGEVRVGALLRTLSPRFWERDSRNLCHRVRAVDSLGNRYPSYEERWGTWGDNGEEWMYVNGHADARGPLHTDYAIWVYGVDPAAEWVRLEYDWMGRSFSMTVDMKEAGT